MTTETSAKYNEDFEGACAILRLSTRCMEDEPRGGEKGIEYVLWVLLRTA